MNDQSEEGRAKLCWAMEMGIKMMRESASTTQRALLSEKQEGNKKIYDMNSGGVSFVALGFACWKSIICGSWCRRQWLPNLTLFYEQSYI